MKENGAVGGTALSLLSMFGMGVQTYASRAEVMRRDNPGKFLYRLTDPSTAPEAWLAAEGLTVEKGLEALRVESQRLADEAAKRKGKNGRAVRSAKNGKLTAYGKRRSRLRKHLREK